MKEETKLTDEERQKILKSLEGFAPLIADVYETLGKNFFATFLIFVVLLPLATIMTAIERYWIPFLVIVAAIFFWLVF